MYIHPYWPVFAFPGESAPRPAATAIFPGVFHPECLDPDHRFFCEVTQRRHGLSEECGTLFRGSLLRDAAMLSPEAIAAGPLAIRRGLLAAAIRHLRVALDRALALDRAMAAERCREWPGLLSLIESSLHLAQPLVEVQIGFLAIAGRPEARDPMLAWMRAESARRPSDPTADRSDADEEPDGGRG